MPNRDGTGPLGKGPATGRLRGDCGGGRGNKANNAGQGQGLGRRNAVAGAAGGGRGLRRNNADNTQNK
jgi:hypothetical protein